MCTCIDDYLNISGICILNPCLDDPNSEFDGEGCSCKKGYYKP